MAQAQTQIPNSQLSDSELETYLDRYLKLTAELKEIQTSVQQKLEKMGLGAINQLLIF